ncbi:sugar kinase [Cognatiyoonia sp.]|uniref:sugar kinase n=1 Tax=Cognatiyoonia sp. TaxID=2211652 RepID=UPI003F695231
MVKDGAPVGCLGEVMLELVLGSGTNAQLGVAGDTYNTAVYIAHEYPDVKVDYVTGLGKDGFSDRIRAHMAKYNVGSDRIFTHPDRGPGLYAIETDDKGERSFTYWRSASAARCLGNPDLPEISDMLNGLTHLLFTGISLAILEQANRNRLFEAIDAFRANGGVVAFDSNYRPHLWGDANLARRETERAWATCDIGMPSVDDEMALFGDASTVDVLKRFAGYGIGIGTLKRGADGPVGLDGTVPEITSKPTAVVDTTAAGDSFNAAYLGALISGSDNATSMRAGHDLACKVIAQKGAIIF